MNDTVFISELSQEIQDNIKETITNRLKSEYHNISIAEVLENCMNDRLCNLVDNEYIFQSDINIWLNGKMVI